MDLFPFAVDGLTILAGFLVFVLAPGFTILLVFFPRPSDLGSFKRLAWSMVLSTVLVFALIPLMHVFDGSDLPLWDIGLGFCLFSVILFVTWVVEVWYLGRVTPDDYFGPPQPEEGRAAPPSSGSWSGGWPRLARMISRFVHGRSDRYTGTAMTRVLWHESVKRGGGVVEHTWLIDAGMEMDIHQIDENKWRTSNRALLRPPYPKTRFFELVIRGIRDGGSVMVDDLEIVPVQTVRHPDVTLLGKVIHRGEVIVAARIRSKSATADIQWIYTHDFHLFAILHGDETPAQVADRVLQKLDEIVTAIRDGSRISSHIEETARLRDEAAAPTPPRKAPGMRIPTIIEVPATFRHAPVHTPIPDRRSLQKSIVRDLSATRITPATYRPLDRPMTDLKIPDDLGLTAIQAAIRELREEEWLSQ